MAVCQVISTVRRFGRETLSIGDRRGGDGKGVKFGEEEIFNASLQLDRVKFSLYGQSAENHALHK